MNKEQILLGTLYATIDCKFKKYRICAFPGPEIIKDGRVEHSPYHCHVYKDEIEYRISIGEEIAELDEKKIPRDLKKYLEDNSEEIRAKIISIFHKGTLEKLAS